jgi:hypothetical protein
LMVLSSLWNVLLVSSLQIFCTSINACIGSPLGSFCLYLVFQKENKSREKAPCMWRSRMACHEQAVWH